MNRSEQHIMASQYHDDNSIDELTGLSASLYANPTILHVSRPRYYAYYYKQWHQYEMSYHQHHSTEIMYIISGECRIELLSESIALQKGQFIVIDADVPHRLIVGDMPCRMLNLEFGLIETADNKSILQQLIRQEPKLAEMLKQRQEYMVLSDAEEVYYALKSLVLELDQSNSHSSAMMSDLLFAQLLVRIARLRGQSHHHARTTVEWYVEQSIQFMHQNYDRSIRIEHIAAAVNVHPGYLHRIFKRHTGTTPNDYLTSLRMDKAMMLLSQTDIPISEIADYVGVSSRPYFHLLFKKHTGYTPADYRAQSERYHRTYLAETNEI